MLKKENLRSYQRKTVDYVKDNQNCALFLDMGLGKTVSTLTAIKDLFDDFQIAKVLIIAPLQVANFVWEQECKNWEHLHSLKTVICTGNAKKRKEALNSDCDIYITSVTNIQWLIENYGAKWKWDMLVIDESSMFKSSSTVRFKSIKKVLGMFSRKVILTGTPSPNGYLDLWSQMFILDMGDRLQRTAYAYKHKYFDQNPWNYKCDLKKGADTLILKQIDDICLSMKSEDYLDLPEVIDVYKYAEFDDKTKGQYVDLKKHMLIEINDKVLTATTAATLHGKLMQFSNGAIYDEDKNVTLVHDLKLQLLKDLVDDNPSENILVMYSYRSDIERIVKAFPYAEIFSKESDSVVRWNKGSIRMLIGHPASMGHGLNLQYGGSMIVWFGLPTSLEYYQQTIKRLNRSGQTKPVRNVKLVIKNTIDEITDIALSSKATMQDLLLTHLKYEDS